MIRPFTFRIPVTRKLQHTMREVAGVVADLQDLYTLATCARKPWLERDHQGLESLIQPDDVELRLFGKQLTAQQRVDLDLFGQGVLSIPARGMISPVIKADSKAGLAGRDGGAPKPPLLAARRLLEAKVFPAFDLMRLPMQYWYIANSVAARTVKMWRRAVDRLDSERAARLKAYTESAAKAAQFKDWYDAFIGECKQDNPEFNLTGRFLRNDCWVPARRALEKDDIEKALKRWPYERSVLEALQGPYRELWEGPVDGLVACLKADLDRKRFEKVKEMAAIRRVHPSGYAMPLLLGINYAPFSLKVVEDRPEFSFDLLQLEANPDAPPSLAGATLTGRRHGRISELVVKEDEESSRSRWNWTDPVLGPLTGTVAEGMVLLRDRKFSQPWGDRSKLRAHISVTVTLPDRPARAPYDTAESVTESKAGNPVSAQVSAMSYFLSVKEAGDRHKAAVHPGLRTLSVDLGTNPPLAWSVAELRRGALPQGVPGWDVPDLGWEGHARVVAKGRSPRPTDDFEQMVVALRRKTAYVDKALGLYKLVFLGRYDPEKHKGYKPALATLDLTLDDVPERRERGEPKWERFRMAYLDGMADLFRRETELRIGQNTSELGCVRAGQGPSAAMFHWMYATRELIALRTSWNNLGRPPAAPGESRNRNACARAWRGLRNIRLDLARKVSGHLASLVRQHNVHILLLENMGGKYRTSNVQDPEQNLLLSVWGIQGLLDRIEGAMADEAVLVANIDPRFTSQLDPMTGEFGYYDAAENKHELIVSRDNKRVRLNADSAAALNLQRRFWLRHSDFVWMRALPVKVKKPKKPKKGESPAPPPPRRLVPVKMEFGKRVQASLADLGFNEGINFLENGHPGSFSLEVGDHTASGDKSVTLYRHGESWLEWEAHREAVETILGRPMTKDTWS